MMWGFNTQLAKCKREREFSSLNMFILCSVSYFYSFFYNFVTSTYNTYLLDLSSPKARQECLSKQLLEPLVKTSRIGTVVKVNSTLIQNDYILRAIFIAKMRAYFGKYILMNISQNLRISSQLVDQCESAPVKMTAKSRCSFQMSCGVGTQTQRRRQHQR